MKDTTITIKPVKESAALLKVYPNQDQSQDCFIALDLEGGRVWADYNPEIGNAVPMAVGRGVIQRYAIPLLQAESANQLMQDLQPLLARVRGGTEIVWDGSNYVARLSEDAESAEEEIDTAIQQWEPDLYWNDAADWLEGDKTGVVELVRVKGIEGAMDELDGNGTAEDTPVLLGLRSYLERIAQQEEPV